MLLQPVLDHTPLYRMLKGEINNPNMVLAHITRSLTLFGVLRFAYKDAMDEYISLRDTKLDICFFYSYYCKPCCRK